MNWEAQLERIPTFVATYGVKLLAAILIYIIGKMIARILSNIARKIFARGRMDNTLADFAGKMIYALLLVFVIIAAIGKLGIQTTSLVAILGASVLAIGLALQGSLSNFASGVMLILFKPFKVGDSVTAAGITGVVHELDIFHTIIVTSDNKKVIIPNTPVASGPITNFSAMPTRRIELSVSVPGTVDMNKVRDILKALMDADQRILKDPSAAIVITEATPGEIKFGLFAHVKNADMGVVQADLTEKIKLSLTTNAVWA